MPHPRVTWNRRRLCAWSAGVLFALLCGVVSTAAAANRFDITLSHSVASKPLTGRLLVMVSAKPEPELYPTISWYEPIFGMDVDQWKPGATVAMGPDAIGSPMKDLAALPAGDYYVQADLVTYQHVTRSDGHSIWVPVLTDPVVTFAKPGNVLSDVRRVHIDPSSSAPIKLVLDNVIPPVSLPQDSPWLKHIKIRSDVMSRFWGTSIYVVANVLLPKGYAEHPNAHYPVVFPFGHGSRPFEFNTDPASNTARAQARAKEENVKTGYEFYQEWDSEHFPRVIAITIQTPSPYFLESYAVNSANNGPWGTALTKEIIPDLEKRFRIIAKPYARIAEGASTGGWEALALQLYYPKYFGGAWIFNPDPISFRHDQLSNIYQDKNMFAVRINRWISFDHPFKRTHEGQPIATLRGLARLEAVLGSHERSGYQLAIWQATHGPVGKDGYPIPLYDNLTGKIYPSIAAYYRKHGFDLTYYVADNWRTLGPELRGKLHFISGEMDDFYLNLAVYDFQHMIETHAPAGYPISFTYGRPEKGHGWHNKDWAGTVRDMAAYIKQIAPPGSNITQWNY